MRRLPSLLAVACLATATLVACIGPQGGHHDGYEQKGPPPSPTGPIERISTHLRGVVIDAATLQAVAGATVSAEGQSVVSGADGTYALSNLYMAATQLQTVKEGYDTLRTQLAMNGGEVAYNPRLVRSPSSDR